MVALVRRLTGKELLKAYVILAASSLCFAAESLSQVHGVPQSPPRPAAARARSRTRVSGRRPNVETERAAWLSSSLEPTNLTFPHVSSISEARDFYVFHNVMLQNNSLVYFHFNQAQMPKDLPAALRLSRYEEQIDMPVIVVNASSRANYSTICGRHNLQTKPALLFSGSPWDHNFFEFFGTSVMPMFQTATTTGLLDPGRILALERISGRDTLLAELHNPKTRSPFTLISGRSRIFGAPWSYLVDSITADQQSLEHVSGTCYRTLVVSEDAVLRFLYEKVEEMKTAAYREYRADWLQKFRTHLIAAEKVHLRTQGKHWPQSIGDAGTTYRRPRVALASRKLRLRGIRNEQDIVDYLTHNWDVNVTLAKFNKGLAASVALMQETDVLIGMHGAGMTNSLWMKEGGVLLQMLPYGWEIRPGELIRSCISADMPLASHGHYLQWVNPHAQHAYFDWDIFMWSYHEWDKHPLWGPKVANYSEHPTEAMPKPTEWDAPHFWMYQSTFVDLASFGPVLDEAMALVGANRTQNRQQMQAT